MLTATQTFQRIPPLEAGVYTAVCTMIIDLGIQYNQTFDKSSQQVKIIWEIVGETVEMNGEVLPRQVSKDFTVSLDERSTLRKTLQSWRGKPFTPEELQGFELRKLVGANCQLQLIHKENERGVFAVVDSIMALPKGMPQTTVKNTYIFDMDDPSTYEVFEKLPKYAKDKIIAAENFSSTGIKVPESNVGNKKKEEQVYIDSLPGKGQVYSTPSDSYEELSVDDELLY